MNKTSIRRTRPVKPLKTVPVQKSANLSRVNALSILRNFYLETRRQINGETLVSINSDNRMTCLSFQGNDFNLELNIKEGAVS